MKISINEHWWSYHDKVVMDTDKWIIVSIPEGPNGSFIKLWGPFY